MISNSQHVVFNIKYTMFLATDGAADKTRQFSSSGYLSALYADRVSIGRTNELALIIMQQTQQMERTPDIYRYCSIRSTKGFYVLGVVQRKRFQSENRYILLYCAMFPRCITEPL